MAEKKIAHGVVALSSAAVLAIYGAGYARTREAADRFTQQAADRRSRTPIPASEGPAEPGQAIVAPPAAPRPEPAAPGPTAAPVPTAVARGPEEKPPVAPRPVAAPAPAAPADNPEPLAGSSASPEVPSVAAGEQPAPAAEPLAQTAPPPVVPAAPAADPAKPAYKDGTYYGWGTSRHGDIYAEVVIEEGRIVVARVEKCQTRWSCNWVSPIPPVILRKQATTYDYVSGATESSDAFQGAVAEALAQAK